MAIGKSKDHHNPFENTNPIALKKVPIHIPKPFQKPITN